MTVNDKAYQVIRLLGKGKGGYSYLVSDGQQQYVLKQIHHEPCDYYQFGDKLASELDDYRRLSDLQIPMPRLIDVDVTQERILKEYIEGPTVLELVLSDRITEMHISQVRRFCDRLYSNGLNIDYFPTNFILRDDTLWYIDYECNGYMEQWNFENWGIQYWSKTPQLLAYAKDHGFLK